MTHIYRNREEAGRSLAEALAGEFASVVVGIPRGGVVVALPVALRFGLPLTVVFARRLAAPHSPELTFGALDEDGAVLLDLDTVRDLALDAIDIDEVGCHVSAEIRRRQVAYRALPLEPRLLAGGALLVDDGLATGLTVRCAVRLLRQRGASRVVVAVPCASSAAVRDLRGIADEVICPLVSDSFLAVGAHYRDFEPVPDEQVIRVLASIPATTFTAGSARPRGQGEPIGRGR